MPFRIYHCTHYLKYSNNAESSKLCNANKIQVISHWKYIFCSLQSQMPHWLNSCICKILQKSCKEEKQLSILICTPVLESFIFPFGRRSNYRYSAHLLWRGNIASEYLCVQRKYTFRMAIIKQNKIV